MILNSKNSNFIFSFPKGWFYPILDEEYKDHFARSSSPYKNIVDYINYTIQDVTWPSFSLETVEQNFRSVTSHHKGGHEASRQREHSFTVNFRTTEGYLNYFIFEEQLKLFWEYNNELNIADKTFMPNINLYLLDDTGHLISLRTYTNIIITEISDIEMSYSSNTPEYKTFSVGFKCTRIKDSQEKQ